MRVKCFSRPGVTARTIRCEGTSREGAGGDYHIKRRVIACVAAASGRALLAGAVR
jgi:hypothetical protein